MSWKSLLLLPLLGTLALGCATTSHTVDDTEVAVVDSTDPEMTIVTTETTVAATMEDPLVVEVEPYDVQEPVTVPAAPQIPPVLNSVEFLNPDLIDRVVVTRTTYERTPGDAFKVLCTLRNLTNEPIRLQARTQYFSDDRLHQEGPGAWQLVFLPANGIDTYTAYSYGTNLGYYYVEVQEM